MATVVLTFWLATYYNVIIGWAMFYLFSSFTDPLPWVSCNNTWNTHYCLETKENITKVQVEMNNNVDYCNDEETSGANETTYNLTTSSSQEFYEYVFTQLCFTFISYLTYKIYVVIGI